jgi:hypothetical protein
VLAVPAEIALGNPLKPSPNHVQIGNKALTIITSGRVSEGHYVLNTDIRVDAAKPSELQLFVPGLERTMGMDGPVNSDAIITFVSQIRTHQNEPKPIEDEHFESTTYLPISRDFSAPAYFVVDYPVTLRTKETSFCVTVSLFSAYPLNLDDSFCGKP